MTTFEIKAWLVVEADNLLLAERLFSEADGSSLLAEDQGRKYVIRLSVEDGPAEAAE